MNAGLVLVAGVVLVAALVAVPARPARAACDVRALVGGAKAPLQAATDLRVVSWSDSERQYDLLQRARGILAAAPRAIEAACASDEFHTMIAKETSAVYRAWGDALSAGRAMYLARNRRDCAISLRSVASGAVTNGWGLLNRLFRERHTDSFGTAHRLLLARARDLDIALPPLGDGDALYALAHKNHWDTFGLAAFLPPYCSRY